MAQLLRQSTTVTIRLGPFLDKTDGVSEETALTPAVEISQNHGGFAARNSATAIAHDAAGWYAVELDASDTAVLGPLIAKSDDAANHLPVWREFLVAPAAVFDALVAGSSPLTVDVTRWLGAALASPDSAGHPKVTIKAGSGAGEVALAAGLLEDQRLDNLDAPISGVLEDERLDNLDAPISRVLEAQQGQA